MRKWVRLFVISAVLGLVSTTAAAAATTDTAANTDQQLLTDLNSGIQFSTDGINYEGPTFEPNRRYRPVVCAASNIRGQVFYARGYFPRPVQRAALRYCAYYSYICRAEGCWLE
jgi:hypothetical protein